MYIKERPIGRRVLTEEGKQLAKERKAMFAKQQREWLKTLSPEALKERKDNQRYDKERRIEEREQKARDKQRKIDVKRENNILQFMLKNDVIYSHHGTKDSSTSRIQKQIDLLKAYNKPTEYDPYIWNYQGEGHNTLPLCQMGNIWSCKEFNSIYDVPLDGTYQFQIYDSGQRGLGSFNKITAILSDETFIAPKVNPGALMPQTC